MVGLTLKDSGALGIIAAKEAIEDGASDLVDGLAKRAVEILEKNYETSETYFGPWKPLSGVTKALTGRTKPLKSMKNSIEVVDLGPNIKEVLINHPWATVQEFGATIQVTEKMRKYMAAQGFPLKQSTTAIHIPPRPSVAPTIAQLQNEMGEIINQSGGFFSKIRRAVVKAIGRFR